MNKETETMLETLGKDMEQMLDRVKFIGVQDGHGFIPSICSFNCLLTGTTFLTNSITEAEEKLKIIRKSIDN